MPRAARYSDSQILDATARIIASGGPKAATIGAIGHELAAPSGSIYHRFPSRNALLGRVWMQKAAEFQGRFVDALQRDTPVEAGLEAALSMPRSVRIDPVGAKILLLYRRQDFLSDEWSQSMREEAKRLGIQVAEAMQSITKRLFGNASAENRRAAAFALLDVPMAAVRRHVIADERPPPVVDILLRETYQTIIEKRIGRAMRSSRRSQ